MKPNNTLFLSIFLALIIISCGARKVQTEKLDTEIVSQSFDYSKFIQNDFRLDKGVIFTKEYYDSGVMKSERYEQKNEVKTRYEYKVFKIYKTYKITETIKVKTTEKKESLWWLLAIPVIGVLIYFLVKKGNILF